MDDPVIKTQMEAKYPARSHPLPESVSKGQCVDNLRGLKDLLLGLEAGVSPGTGGMRPEYLTCLAEVLGAEPNLCVGWKMSPFLVVQGMGNSVHRATLQDHRHGQGQACRSHAMLGETVQKARH